MRFEAQDPSLDQIIWILRHCKSRVLRAYEGKASDHDPFPGENPYEVGVERFHLSYQLEIGMQSGYMRIEIRVMTHCILERRQRTCRRLLRWSERCQVQLARVLCVEFSSAFEEEWYDTSTYTLK